MKRTASAKLERLSDYRDELIIQATEQALEREVSSWRCFIEGTINPDDPILTSSDIQRETGWQGMAGTAMASDRSRGAFAPFFRSEMELAAARSIARIVAYRNETGVSIIENLSNYTLGDEGITLTYQPRDKALKDDERIKRAQQVLDLFVEKNKVTMRRQKEALQEAHVAGECLIILREHHDGVPRVKVRSVDHLCEPSSPDTVLQYHGYEEGLEDGLDWSFGVATPPFEYDDVRGYFCAWYGAMDAWEFLPPTRCTHVKLNVPSDVKRGLSDYYAAYANIERASRGFGASAEGATLQSSIAYIEKFKQGTPKTAMEDGLPTPNTILSSRPGRQGLIPVKVEQVGSGRILRTDRDVMYGPLGAPQGAKLIEVFQAVLRRVGTRWSMPEWMISGDASNNNMASSVTAGSAFDVASQARQRTWGDIWVEVAENAMRMMGVDVDELNKLARLDSKGSQIAAREELQDEQIREIRHNSKVLSKKTWAEEVGLDYDEQRANIESEPVEAPPGMGGPGGGPPGMPPGGPGGDPNASGGPGGGQAGRPFPRVSSGTERAEGLAFSVAERVILRERKLLEADGETESEGDVWRTINGTPVLIGDDGVIKTGPLKGRDLDDVKNEEPKKKPKDKPDGSEEQPGRGNKPAGAPDKGELREPGGVRGSGAQLGQKGEAPAEHTAKPLEGLPTKPIKVGDKTITPGPLAKAREAAEAYMKQAGLEYKPPTTYAKVDAERATKIAAEYDRMEHKPDDPKVKAAYAAMIKETVAQYQAIKATGLKVEFIKPGMADPYAASPRLATEDVRENNHLWVYPTASGFGSSEKFDASTNPLLAQTGEKISGQPACANDVFRVVHDYFGHIKEGNGFRADGEENAWRSHSAMYSPEARLAMTSETRGQNSWVNYGPHGETNRTAKSDDTVFADQKTGLMPEWVMNDGAHDSPGKGASVGKPLPPSALNVPIASMKPETQKAIASIESTYKPANPEGSDSLTRHATEVNGKPTFTPERQKLHDELVGEVRGQAKPHTDGKPEFVLMGGGPASGKTAVKDTGKLNFREHHVSVNADDDFKFKIPEYRAMVETGDKRAAVYAHEESSHLAKRAVAESLAAKQNVVLDGTGDAGLDNVLKKVREAKAAGFDVRAEYMTKPIDQALAWSEDRMKKSGRFVPMSLLAHTHRKVSEVVPALIASGEVPHLRVWDTQLSEPDPDRPGKLRAKVRLVAEARGKELTIADEGLWRDFLDKAKWHGPTREAEGDEMADDVDFHRAQQIASEVANGVRSMRGDSKAEAALRAELVIEIDDLLSRDDVKSIELIRD